MDEGTLFVLLQSSHPLPQSSKIITKPLYDTAPVVNMPLVWPTVEDWEPQLGCGEFGDATKGSPGVTPDIESLSATSPHTLLPHVLPEVRETLIFDGILCPHATHT